LPSIVTDLEVEYLDQELKNDLIDSYLTKPHPFIFPEFTNLLTSIVRDPNYNKDYLGLEIFNDFFNLLCHAPTFKTQAEKNLYDNAFTCHVGPFDGATLNCPPPCCTISLGGVRTIREDRGEYRGTDLPDLPSGTDAWPRPKPAPRLPVDRFLRNMHFGDVASLFYYTEMGLFGIIHKLIQDFDLSGKYLFPSDNLSIMLLNKCAELMRKLDYPYVSSLQLEGLFLRVLGWQSSNVVRKIDSGMIMINSAFGKLLSRLIPQVLYLYSQSTVIDAVTQARAVPPAESEIAIQNTLATFKSTMEIFNSNNNWYLTLNAYLWLIIGLSLLEQNLDTIGVPATLRDNPIHYIPAAYDILVENKTSSFSPRTQNRYLAYLPLATNARKILFDIEFLRIDDNRMVRIFLAKNIPRFLAFNDSFKSVYGLNLAAPEYRTEGALRLPHEAL
jgi:hypothetical protein